MAQSIAGSTSIRTQNNRTAAPADAVELTLRVRYAETDQMGVVHHANYLVWFEAARSEFCRQRDIDYRQMETDGLLLPMAESHCRYLKPAFYDDEVVVRSWVMDVKRSVLRIGYEATRGDTLLATGETVQVLVDRASMRPRSFPQHISDRFKGTTRELEENE
jgi:acyl-CoA thioester hydrolase